MFNSHFPIEFSESVSDCTKAITLNKDYSKAYYRRGKAYVSLKETKKAIDDYKRFLEYEPNNEEVIN